MSPPGETGTASTASRLEQFVRAFEEAWARGERPQLVNFLSSVRKEERCRALVELALAELELRLKAGEPARAEDYLACFGELAADPAAAVSLIAAEYRLRRRREPALQAAEMIARFPLHAEALQQRLAEIDQDSEHGAILSTFRDDPP